MIQAGDADAVVTGGSEAALTPLARAAFAALDATSETGISRPFDARRDGFVMGEGAGVLVLEDAERGRGARRARPRRGARLRRDVRRPPPDRARPRGRGRRGARSALALADAGLEAADVDYVNAHGTSTPLNDRAETHALKAALGDRAARRPGVLDQVGDRPPARRRRRGRGGRDRARAARPRRAADARLRGARRGPRPRLRPRRRAPARTATDGRAPVALSNSFGFGGHNAVLCLGAAA